VTAGPIDPPSVWRYVWGGALATAVAVAGNLWWYAAFTRMTGVPRPAVIGPAEIVGATAASVLLAAGIYLLLSRALVIATPLYVLGSIAVAAATMIAPLVPVMPDGSTTPDAFPHLAMPMHLWAGIAAATVVPLVVHLGRSRRRSVPRASERNDPEGLP
jgi:hypothetical protein